MGSGVGWDREGRGGEGRGGEGGVGWGRVGSGKNLQLWHPWSCHDAHTVAHATFLGHRGTGSNLRSPPPKWFPPLVPFIGAIVPVVTLKG